MCYSMVESVAYDRNRVIALKLGKATGLPYLLTVREFGSWMWVSSKEVF